MMTTGASREYTLALKELCSRQEALIRSADRIVISQEGVSSEIASLRTNLAVESSDLGSLLEELAATFDWGLTELIWQTQQQTELLKRVSRQLAAPLDMQAKELRKRAQYAYAQGWYDEALNDFLTSAEKNPYDFIVQHYIGNILLFHRGHLEESVQYFERAAKFARPEAPRCAAFSLLHAGEARRRQGRLEDAYTTTKRAEMMPSAPAESAYQLACICAVTGRYDEAEASLHEAILRNRLYCAKCSSDEVFASMHERIVRLLDRIEEAVSKSAVSTVEQAEEAWQWLIREVIPFLRAHGMSCIELPPKPKRTALKEAQALISKRSILDSWRALELSETFLGSVAARLQGYPWEDELDRIKKMRQSKWEARSTRHAIAVGVGAGALLAFLISKILMPGFPWLSGGLMFGFVLSLVFFWWASGILVGGLWFLLVGSTRNARILQSKLHSLRDTVMRYASKAAELETTHTRWRSIF